MSLNKAIAHGKEFRNPIHSCDSWCWNHGGCPYCLKNRVYQQRKETDKAEILKTQAEAYTALV